MPFLESSTGLQGLLFILSSGMKAPLQTWYVLSPLKVPNHLDLSGTRSVQDKTLNIDVIVVELDQLMNCYKSGSIDILYSCLSIN